VARLSIDDVTKAFGSQLALDSVSMTVEDGEFVAVLGPSGCGKTTLLRLVAGFDPLTGGSISLGGRQVSGRSGSGKLVHLPPEHRRMGIVFQSYALWPHMSVEDNVAYALRVQKVPTDERSRRVAAALETVGLTGFRERRPAMLSGGQRQRVALARCLAMQPEIVLLDEPLANLDVHLRAAMEEEFAAFHKRTGTTMFYITHDQAEAMALADRIAVMDQGKVLQLAKPSQLYREPANETVARFIGAGIILPATRVGHPAVGIVGVDVFGHRAMVRCAPGHLPRTDVRICIRAGDLAASAPQPGTLVGRVQRMIYQGGHFQAEVELDGGLGIKLPLQLPEPAAFAEGDPVGISIKDGWCLPAEG
jgi:iron(III) transport system ATP-binding protein